MEGGAAVTFRRCIETVLLRAKLVVNGSPPNEGSAAIRYKWALLDSCVPVHTQTDARRKIRLDSLFSGDMRSDVIEIFVPAGDFTLATWASMCSDTRLGSNQVLCT